MEGNSFLYFMVAFNILLVMVNISLLVHIQTDEEPDEEDEGEFDLGTLDIIDARETLEYDGSEYTYFRIDMRILSLMDDHETVTIDSYLKINTWKHRDNTTQEILIRGINDISVIVSGFEEELGNDLDSYFEIRLKFDGETVDIYRQGLMTIY